jgi:hypothetical protein
MSAVEHRVQRRQSGLAAWVELIWCDLYEVARPSPAPVPARLLEWRIPGGPGIMLDDLVASVYALPPLTLLINEGIIVVQP